ILGAQSDSVDRASAHHAPSGAGARRHRQRPRAGTFQRTRPGAGEPGGPTGAREAVGGYRTAAAGSGRERAARSVSARSTRGHQPVRAVRDRTARLSRPLAGATMVIRARLTARAFAAVDFVVAGAGPLLTESRHAGRRACRELRDLRDA